MKYRRFLNLVVILALVVALLSLALTSRKAQAQTTLPTASQVFSQMTIGWNIGNTLEAQCGETAWGNPMVTQQLINSVKAAGFNSVRIPVAWDCHTSNGVIDSAWLARVKTVVDYAISQNMYVIINIHWDGGWLENHVTFADQTAVNQKQNAYWTQIANYFNTYNEHLLFAGTNEVHQDYGEPTAEYITVQQSYNQTFVNAVRATGGNNASRTLVVQTYNTNMWHGLHYFSMPTDSIANRLIVETHYYDPYDYTLNASGPCLAWGASYTQYSQCSWAQEAYVDDLFSQVRVKWVDAGIPVIIGEYGVVKRSGLDLNSRQYWNKYINQAAKANGIKTFYWDNGTSDFAIFDRNSGAIIDQGVLDAIKQGAGIGTGPTPTVTKTPTNGPSLTWTKTATVTTPTVTATNPPNVGLKVQYKAADTNATDNAVKPHFVIVNGATSSVALSNLKIRYYFSENTTQAFSSACDYAVLGCSNITTSFVSIPPVTGADHYLEVGFTFGAGSLAAGANTGEIQTRFNKADWSNFNEADDYSFDPTKAAFADWTKVALYNNGVLVWGTPPGGAPVTSTPTPSPTSTPTKTLTPTVTNTFTPVTATITPTVRPDNTPVNAPDLWVSSVMTAPQGWTGGCANDLVMGVSVTIRNHGQFTLPAGPFVVDVNGTQQTVNGLAADATVTLWFPNTGNLTIKVDATNLVWELDESNNIFNYTTITATPPAVCTRTPTPTLTVSVTPTRTITPTITPTVGMGTCSPVSASITAPFTFDGAGALCWQSSNLGTYLNSWNTTSVSINGVNISNLYLASGSYPAKIGGYWYISYNSSVAWGHFEAR